MSLVKEFKEFAIKGNAIDLAVGVIIGAAFGTIIDSIINDLVMPLVGFLIGSPDFSDLYLILRDPNGGIVEGMALDVARNVDGANIFAYGSFITAAVNFLLLAWVIFLMVKFMNRLRKQEEETPEPAEPSTEEKLLTEIRDALKDK